MIVRFKCKPANILTLTKQFHRELHLTKTLQLNPNNVKEVRIPVPWGHIAGKWWGDTNEQPILALHGWQDNASSFDPLLELLPSSKPVLAIDSPGHGFSSHYPPAMLYHSAHYVLTCRRIQKYFKWDKNMTILGHSEGGITGFLFSAIYPECVNTLITLDVIKPFAIYPTYFSKIGKKLDDSVKKGTRVTEVNPKYSLEEIEDRWVKGSGNPITPETVKILLKRAVKYDKESGKYSLTRDPKLKLSVVPRFSEDQCLEFARNMDCHYLAIKFTEGKFFDFSLKNCPTFIDTVTKATKSFKLVTVEGIHHGHVSNPENVVPVISEFLETVHS